MAKTNLQQKERNTENTNYIKFKEIILRYLWTNRKEKHLFLFFDVILYIYQRSFELFSLIKHKTLRIDESTVSRSVYRLIGLLCLIKIFVQP